MTPTVIRAATESDLPCLHAVLRGSAPSTMFLRSNLLHHGLQGSAPHAMSIYVDTQSGAWGGVAAITNNGYLLAHAPAAATAFWSAFVGTLHGRMVRGMTGAPKQVQAMFDALGAGDRAKQIDEVEPLYAMDLADLPDWAGDLRSPVPDQRDLMAAWQCAGNAETLGSDPGVVGLREAELQVDSQLSKGVLRVLYANGSPVCKTAFNAILPDMVQVGGVYTPEPLRGQGHARRAVALHLAEARRLGVEQAILFAANPAAARAYDAIGFERVGRYRVALFEKALEVGA